MSVKVNNMIVRKYWLTELSKNEFKRIDKEENWPATNVCTNVSQKSISLKYDKEFQNVTNCCIRYRVLWEYYYNLHNAEK